MADQDDDITQLLQRIDGLTPGMLVQEKFARADLAPPSTLIEAATYLGVKLAMIHHDYHRVRLGLAALDLLQGHAPKLSAAATPTHEATRALTLYAMADNCGDETKQAALRELADEGAARARWREQGVKEAAAVAAAAKTVGSSLMDNPVARGAAMAAGAMIPVVPVGALGLLGAGHVIRENVPQREDIAMGGAAGGLFGNVVGNAINRVIA